MPKIPAPGKLRLEDTKTKAPLKRSHQKNGGAGGGGGGRKGREKETQQTPSKINYTKNQPQTHQNQTAEAKTNGAILAPNREKKKETCKVTMT